MWQSQIDILPDTAARLSIANSAGQSFSFRDFFTHCESSGDFALWFTEQLLGIEKVGFHWELPSLTIDSIDQPFECVVVSNSSFAKMTPDPYSFANQFNQAEPESSVISFANLSGDAYLLAPTPKQSELDSYTHLAAFLASAPQDQVVEFWNQTGELAISRLSQTPYWLSTAGMGVAWLHLRFDSRPKYYRHQPYR